MPAWATPGRMAADNVYILRQFHHDSRYSYNNLAAYLRDVVPQNSGSPVAMAWESWYQYEVIRPMSLILMRHLYC